METLTTPPDATPSETKHNWAVPLVSALLVLAVVLAGVWWFGLRDTTTDPATVPASELYGQWLTVGGTTVTYGEDGRWSAQWPGYGPEPFDWGLYTFDGEVLTFFTDPGSRSCEEGQTGTYETTMIDEQTLSLELIEEACSGRPTDFRDGMTRKPA